MSLPKRNFDEITRVCNEEREISALGWLEQSNPAGTAARSSWKGDEIGDA
jgi:hypothetical protein